ncbi:MAG: hypothetical protein ACSHX3_01800 [Litorimonas sp.]
MTDMFDHFAKATMRCDDASAEIAVAELSKGFDETACEEWIEDMLPRTVSIVLPLDRMIEMQDASHILMPSAGHVTQICVETDQMIEGEGPYLEALTGVKHLGLAMRRPKEGLGTLDFAKFQSSLLSYIDADVPINFTLYGRVGAGPLSRQRNLPAIQDDIDRIDGLFAGFPNYQGCTYRKSMRQLIG